MKTKSCNSRLVCIKSKLFCSPRLYIGDKVNIKISLPKLSLSDDGRRDRWSKRLFEQDGWSKWQLFGTT